VIARIKNRHFRRLAIIAAVLIYMIISPFVVLWTELPKFIEEVFIAASRTWKQP
jgi:hypothetical protein